MQSNRKITLTNNEQRPGSVRVCKKTVDDRFIEYDASPINIAVGLSACIEFPDLNSEAHDNEKKYLVYSDAATQKFITIPAEEAFDLTISTEQMQPIEDELNVATSTENIQKYNRDSHPVIVNDNNQIDNNRASNIPDDLSVLEDDNRYIGEDAADSSLSEDNETFHIKNKSNFTIYARVYEVEKGWPFNSYRPKSDVIEIKGDVANNSEYLKVNKCENNRYIYYCNASSKEEAEAIFNDKSPATNMRIELNSPGTLLEIPAFKKVKSSALLKHYRAYLNDWYHVLDLNKSVTKTKVNDSVQRKIKKDEGIKADISISKNVSGDIKLSGAEKEFIKKRDAGTKVMVQQLATDCLGDLLDNKDIKLPRVGLCGSGGGFRAMIGFHGLNAGLSETDILDMLHYRSGTSGSTWAMAELAIMASLSKDKKEYKQYIQKFPERVAPFMRDGVWEKISFPDVQDVYEKALKERSLSQSDFDIESHLNSIRESVLLKWTARLANSVLAGAQNINASKQDGEGVKKDKLKDIRKKSYSKFKENPDLEPMNIFNTVAFTEGYELEVNPGTGDFTVTNCSYRSHVEITSRTVTYIPDEKDRGKYYAWSLPTEQFGKRHDDDIRNDNNDDVSSTSGKAVPLSISSLIAICGSAMTPGWRTAYENMPRLGQIIVNAVGMNPGQTTTVSEKTLIEKPPVEYVDKGWFLGCPFNKGKPGRGGNVMFLRDAGFDYNLPLFPLMRPERECEIIVVYDTDGNLNSEPGRQLYKALQDAKSLKRNISAEWSGLGEKDFINKIKQKILDGELPIVIGNPEDPVEVCFVYVPAVKQCCGIFSDKTLKASGYNPEKVGTLKLDYTEDELKALHEYGRQLGITIAPKIKELMVRRIIAKNELMPANKDPKELICRLTQSDVFSVSGIKEMLGKIDFEYYESILHRLSSALIFDKDNKKLASICEYIKTILDYNAELIRLVQIISTHGASPYNLVELLIALNKVMSVRMSAHTRNEILSVVIRSIDVSDCNADVKSAIQEFIKGNKGETRKNDVNANDLVCSLLSSNDKDKRILSILAMVVRFRKEQMEISRDMLREIMLRANCADFENIASKLDNASGAISDETIQPLIMYSKILASANKQLKDVSSRVLTSAIDFSGLFSIHDELITFNDLHISKVMLDKIIREHIMKGGEIEMPLNAMTIEEIIKTLVNANDVNQKSITLISMIQMINKDKDAFSVEFYKGILKATTDDRVKFICYLRLSFLCKDKCQSLERLEYLKKARGINKDSEIVKSEIKDTCDNLGTRLINYCNANTSLAKIIEIFNLLKDEDELPSNLLYHVAKRTSTGIFRFLLDNLSDVEVAEMQSDAWNKGWNVVHIATRYDRVDLLALLLARSKELFNVKTGSGLLNGLETPTIIAAKYCSHKSLRFLCEHGLHLDDRDQNNRSALCCAYGYDDLESFKILLKAGANPDTRYGWSKINNSLLLQASNDKKKSEYVKALIVDSKVKVNVDTTNDQGESALCLAYCMRNAESFTYLLKGGAKPHTIYSGNKDGNTFIIQACKDKEYEFVKAIYRNDIVKVDQTISNRNIEGESALCWAYHNNDIGSFKLLLKCGADPSSHYSGKKGVKKVFAKVSSAISTISSSISSFWSGKKVDPRAPVLNNFWQQSCYEEKIEFITEILTSNAIVKDKLKENKELIKKLLLLSYNKNNIHLFEALLEAGADPNSLYDEKSSNTYLHQACKDSRLPFVRVLLHYKANINCKNSEKNPETSSQIANRMAKAMSGGWSQGWKETPATADQIEIAQLIESEQSRLQLK